MMHMLQSVQDGTEAHRVHLARKYSTLECTSILNYEKLVAGYSCVCFLSSCHAWHGEVNSGVRGTK